MARTSPGASPATVISRYRRYRGIAPKARLFGLKVLDANGAGRTSDVISAIEFATANKTRLGIDVINLSLGHPIYEPAATDPLVQAVEAAVRAGIVVVVSAGNFGIEPDDRPARLRRHHCRRATRRRRSRSVRSKTLRHGRAQPTTASRHTARADRPGTTAPRSRTSSRRATRLVGRGRSHSTLYANYPDAQHGRQTRIYEAERHEHGRGRRERHGGLVIESEPHGLGSARTTPNAVKAILQYTAVPMTDETARATTCSTQGAGALNAARRVATGRRASIPPIPHSLVADAGAIARARRSTADASSWAQTSSGASTSSGAEPLIYTNRVAWANNIVWGETTSSGARQHRLGQQHRLGRTTSSGAATSCGAISFSAP